MEFLINSLETYLHQAKEKQRFWDLERKCEMLLSPCDRYHCTGGYVLCLISPLECEIPNDISHTHQLSA